MINGLQCWNCCGLRSETDSFEALCPNCGCKMDRAQWPVTIVRDCDPALTVEGPPAATFENIGPLLSDEPGLLSYAMDVEHIRAALEKPNLAALFVDTHHLGQVICGTADLDIAFIYADAPRPAFFGFHNWLIENTEFYGYSIEARIDQLALIHPGAWVANRDVILGPGVNIGPGVVIKRNTRIDPGCEIGPGVMIGQDGARLIKRLDGTMFRARHAGGVRIGDRVYIGPNAVVMKSVWSRPTIIADGAFVGNLANVGHNCTIEAGAVVLPGAILCGRSIVKTGATVGPGAIISDGVTVGAGARVTLGAVVTKDVEAGQVVSGNFAVDHGLQIQHTKKLAAQEHFYFY